MTSPAPAPLPLPADFPVKWRQPGDEALFWFQDLMHFPTPNTPLTQTLQLPAFSVGSTRGLVDLSLPIVGLRYEAHNNYVYGAALPFIAGPAEMEARMEQAKKTIGGIMPTLLARFQGEYLPRILAICDSLRGMGNDDLTLNALAARVAGLLDVYTELWDIHMQVNLPPMAAVFGFDDFLASVLGPAVERTGHLMLQGFPNKSVESGHALWQLAAEARADAGVLQTLRSTAAPGLREALSATAAGKAFLAKWDAFLSAYGWRTGAFELADPGWIEDGTVPLNQLRAYLANPGAEDPLASQRRQAVERDRIVVETEAKLPPDALPVFRMLLAGAQTYIPLAEDHNFYIDQMAFTCGRIPILALGRGLARQGIVAAADDVFYLELGEIGAISRGDRSDRRAAVTARRASRERSAGVIPPEAIGTPPPADMPPDPLVTKFFGFGNDFPVDSKALRGIGSSGGTVTGTVKVVRTLDEADKLEPGDIMVCHMTMPAWTPLFASVGAVVADSGGVLSHCSIVAREYGIPCVTATRFGTRVLKDGQRVTVDGNRGIVTFG
jgi:phosphohistidine swiveling domain-containing protein